MKQKIVKLAAGLLAVGIMSVPTYAEVMSSRMASCPLCSVGGLVKQVTEYTPWKTVGATDCEHGNPFVKDKVQERKVSTDYVCNHCGYTETHEHVETRHVHP